MAGFLERISAAVERYRLLSPGDRVLLAVSGGCDSVVMLHVLRRLATGRDWRIEIAHFNHQLRGAEGDEDERWVRSLASDQGLAFHASRGDTKAVARFESVSIEMAARQLRHAFLSRTAWERGIRKVAMAHHSDDQVEHFFCRLFRGNSGSGRRNGPFRTSRRRRRGSER